MVVFRGWPVHKQVLFALLVGSLLLLIACNSPCKTVPFKFYERQQHLIPKTIEKEETYTYVVPLTTKKCTREPVVRESVKTDTYSLEIGAKVWLFEPAVLGERNQVKRTIYLRNLQNHEDVFFMDKVYLVNGSEVQRWKHSGLYEIDAGATRRFFVTWTTPYDPLKDVTIQVVDKNNTTATLNEQENCVTIEGTEERTGVRKVLVTENDVKYTPIIKERERKACDGRYNARTERSHT